MNEDIKLIADKEVMSVNYIKKQIYTIRGKQVILDSDVAMLYHYETKEINKAANRNIERFPEDFRFRLTVSELREMRFQFGTASYKKIQAKK